MIAGLSWFGIAAFTKLDSASAKQIRVELGLERSDLVCSRAAHKPDCTFDDRTQQQVDREWARDRQIRAAILHELDLRIEGALDDLHSAETLLGRQEFDFANGLPAAGDAELERLLTLPDLRPLTWRMLYLEDGTSVANPLAAATHDAFRDASPAATKTVTLGAIKAAREQLLEHRATIRRQLDRETEPVEAEGAIARDALMIDIELAQDRLGLAPVTIAWFQAGKVEHASAPAKVAARQHGEAFVAALAPEAAIWQSGWDAPAWESYNKRAIRYVSPITDSQRNQLLGSLLFGLACFVLLLVSPVVTATATAREREAGTLPVLRMTGMSAGELALAMIAGPNVFAALLGGSLLLGGVGLLGLELGLGALLMPLFVLGLLISATHLTAIGLGDALGQRVNAMVVGGLLGVAVLVPGLLGTVLAACGVSSTGLLLGPLPMPLALVSGFTGIDELGVPSSNDLTMTMLGYSLLIQLVLGFICLRSWYRRVEQGWAPLFRPGEGVALALASIGCSVLTLLDISRQHRAEDFDALNLLTFLSSAFLLPVLGWLLIASLRRPARARAVADHVEARWAFLRFQGFVLVTVALVGITYNLVMKKSGLATENSEVMFATLAQLLLTAETAAATLLWASRRREGKLRVAFLGGAVVLMQLASTFVTYGLEVEHVARHNTAAMPLMLGAEVSPYWLAFLMLCWAAGIALVVTALLRKRDAEQRNAAVSREQADIEEASSSSADDDEDDDGSLPGRRLIH